jgi:hypothetical protein
MVRWVPLRVVILVGLVEMAWKQHIKRIRSKQRFDTLYVDL